MQPLEFLILLIVYLHRSHLTVGTYLLCLQQLVSQSVNQSARVLIDHRKSPKRRHFRKSVITKLGPSWLLLAPRGLKTIQAVISIRLLDMSPSPLHSTVDDVVKQRIRIEERRFTCYVTCSKVERTWWLSYFWLETRPIIFRSVI